MKYNDEAERVGTRIKKIREAQGISQPELAEMVGLTPSRISQYEQGQRKPKPPLLKSIADALGVSVLALNDPVTSNPIGAMYALFDMVERYGFKLKTNENGQCVLELDKESIKNTDANNLYKALSRWHEKKESIREFKGEVSDTEYKEMMRDYNFWKWNFSEAGKPNERYTARRKEQLRDQISQLEEELRRLEES